MKSLAAHYKKYATLGAIEKQDREVCKEVLEGFLGMEVQQKSLTIKNGVLCVIAPAPVKVRLREMKREVLIEIKKKLGRRVADMV